MVYKWIQKDLKEIKSMEGKKPTKKLQARTKRFVKQYEKQGWSDIDTWNLDNSFLVWITPRLMRFIELANGYPATPDDAEADTWEHWKDMLQRMHDGFKLALDKDEFDMKPKEIKQVEEAYRLFGKWAQHLWW